MSTIIHASLDENKKTRNGLAGDQTGKEVCIRDWYSKPWSYMLRAKDKNYAIKAKNIAIVLAGNPNLGYDQSNRNSLYMSLQRNNFNPNAIGPCETDCSAFVTACYIAAGVSALNYTSNAPTTSNMAKVFGKTGMFDIYTDLKYLNTDALLMPGDILLRPGSHVVMVNAVNNPYREPAALVRKGDKGNIVKWIQWHLVRKGYLPWYEIDGDAGPKFHNAILSLQKTNNLVTDGIVGAKTRAVLKE